MELCDSGFVPDKKIDLNDFSRGFFDGLKLYVENQEKRTDSGIAIVVGLVAAFPEKINYYTLNDSCELHRLCATGRVAVLINDYMDMQEYLRKPEGNELLQKLEDEWEKTLAGIGFGNDLPETKRITIQSYMAGITLLDDYERSHTDNSSMEIIKVKEIENAISLVHCAAMILDQKEIGGDCLNLQEVVTKKQLEEKYTWLIKGEPENEIQRRLCGIFNVVMLSQLVDDRYDFLVDDKLGIRNIYSSIVKESLNDQKLADKKNTEIQNQYQSAAKKFGVSEIASIGNKLAISIYKKMQYLFPDKYGGYRERLLK